MSTEDDINLFPSTGEDVFESMDGSHVSSKSDQEMLVEVEARKHSEAASKKQSDNKASKHGNPPMKKEVLVKRRVVL